MSSVAVPGRPRVGRASAAGAALATTGLVLGATVDMRFLALAGLGTFGPGILRELGWLRDQDEFQREAARRAGYHAYLAGGLVAVMAVAALQAGRASIDDHALAAALVLAAMWLTWLFSSLMGFWGARRAASSTLFVFGSFWLAFALLSHAAEPASLVAEALLVLPFLVAGWTARRWPRVGGALALAMAAALVVFFAFYRIRTTDPDRLLSLALTFVLLEVPLLASGIALISTRDSG